VRFARELPLLALAAPAALIAFAALIGLGVARHGTPIAVSLAATTLVCGPPLLASSFAPQRRAGVFFWVAALWSTALFLLLPVYFPGERRDAVTIGLSVLLRAGGGESLALQVADLLPAEPTVAMAQVPAARAPEASAAPPPADLQDHQIALPFEGEGRRLSVPVVFEHGGVTRETFMMLDTGATYTTLPESVLAELGVRADDRAPVLTLNTANGPREARVVLLDRVWLGDLALDGVAVTACEDCASTDNAGLLGLNVAGGYNVTIDADRREVVFSGRRRFNRRLDVRPFTALDGDFQRFPGGAVEVGLRIRNAADRAIGGGAVQISCGAETWLVDLPVIPAREVGTAKSRLPRHTLCEAYGLSLDDAWWAPRP
jgi:hypothetical protein